MLRLLMVQEVSVRRRVGTMSDGTPKYAPAEAMRCRMQEGTVLRTLATVTYGERQEVTARGKAFFPAGTALPEMSLIAFAGREYRVLRCDRKRGFMDSHDEVTLI